MSAKTEEIEFNEKVRRAAQAGLRLNVLPAEEGLILQLLWSGGVASEEIVRWSAIAGFLDRERYNEDGE